MCRLEDKRQISAVGTAIAKLASFLASIADGEVETDKPLAPFTSYRIGGATDIWVAPRSEEGVRQVLRAVGKAGAPLFILGCGTNLLVSDRGWRGVTLYIGENLSGWEFFGSEARVRAGTRLWDLVQAAVARGLGGIELLAGIPGGVGGALRMNAGAFGCEIESVTTEVSGCDMHGSAFRARREDLSFGYRCAPELDPIVILSARLGFHPERAEVLNRRVQDILALRAKNQPLEFPSCGSVFKRPAGYYAGALIEEAGLKGERIGGAEVSCRHAGFILNLDAASAADVHGLIRRIEERVFERFGVRLEREVKLVGEFDE
jgi:UDP-N-acetylmuramate dehydrogenase